MSSNFNEAEHPRDNGRFTDKENSAPEGELLSARIPARSNFDADLDEDGFGFISASGIYADFETGHISFWETHRSNLSATPIEVAHGHAGRWRFDYPISSEQMNAIAAAIDGDVAALADSYTSEWGGQNFRAAFSAGDADEIFKRIEEAVADGSNEGRHIDYTEKAHEGKEEELEKFVLAEVPTGYSASTDDGADGCSTFHFKHEESGLETTYAIAVLASETTWRQGISDAIKELDELVAEEAEDDEDED